MSIEGFEWVMKSLSKSMVEIQKMGTATACFAGGIAFLVVVIFVWYRLSGAGKEKWLRIKALVDGAMCLITAAISVLLAFYVVLENKFLYYVRGNATILLEEYGEEAMQGFKVGQLSRLCFYCAAMFVVSVVAAVCSGKAFCRKLCLLKKPALEQVTAQVEVDMPKEKGE